MNKNEKILSFIIIFICILIITIPFFYKSPNPKYNIEIYNNYTKFPIMTYNNIEIINNTFTSITFKQNDIIIVMLKSNEYEVNIKCLN